jgi:cytochrome b
MSTTPSPSRKIQVWDLPLRLFHWLLVISITGAILSVELADYFASGMEWHKRFGMAALSLLVFRVIWGFIGGTHARFSSFVRGPASVITYLKAMKDHHGPAIGHNPLGALSVLALILSLGFQATSGLFITDEVMLEGPLFKYVSESTAHLLGELHEANAGLIFALIGLHIAAILYYRFIKRDNLITPMLTGNKEIPAEYPAEDAKGGHAVLGILVFVIVAALVGYIATL